MFGKLKEKLKSALNIFSRKTEEEAVESVSSGIHEASQEQAQGTRESEQPIVDISAEKETKTSPDKKPSTKQRSGKDPSPRPDKKEAKTSIVKQDLEREPKEARIKPEEKQTKQIPVEKKQERPLGEEPEKREEAKKPFLTKLFARKAPSAEQPSTIMEKVKQVITTKAINAEKFTELFWELELVLLENNVSVRVIERIKQDLQKELVDKPLPRNVEAKIKETLRKTMQGILALEPIDILAQLKKKNPFVIAFFGINGAGKTTSIAKLAHFLQKNGHSVVLAACDTFRAAAIQQLGEHAHKLGVKMIQHDYGSDAAAVAYDAVRYAEKNKVDVVLIDTAGRLHSNTNLMQELEKIIRVTKPDLKLFVGESITGNDCIEQAEQFNKLVQMDGVILTKADVDEKGGAPLSISYIIKKPILFLGVGQKYDDLEPFNADVVLERLGL